MIIIRIIKKYAKSSVIRIHKFYFIIILFIIYIEQGTIEDEKKFYCNDNNYINYKHEKILKSQLIDNYLSRISDDYKLEKQNENERFYKYFNLVEYPENNLIIQQELKTKLLKEISKLKNQTVTNLETFFISIHPPFGNSLITLNNAIFYCEVVNCHNIILNPSPNRKWLITKLVNISNLNITIMQGSNIDCKNKNILCLFKKWDTFYPKIIIPKLKIDLIENEILRNLPNVSVEPNELYIHIRGGDAFKINPLKFYAQPPLCFYEKIIENEKFKNIYIVSMDNSNIIIDALTKKYNKIIYKINNLEHDISLLCNAYNIALSVSSFVISAIKLNNNIKNLWEYDLIRLSEKFLFLHPHIFEYKLNYIYHTMKPSDEYVNKMFLWNKTQEQIKLMLEDNCPYDFVIKNFSK